MLDPVAVERAERSLDEFINSRSKAKDKANELEEAWAKSERKHRQRQREENREVWRCFYLEQAERLERTAAEHGGLSPGEGGHAWRGGERT
jgi:DNA repair ATPase RecN